MKLRELRKEDMLRICQGLTNDDLDQIVKFGGSTDLTTLLNRCAMMQNFGPSWAFVTDDDEAIVIGGYTKLRPGVFHSWFLVHALAWVPYSREITRMAAERTKFMLDGGAHRLETVCLASRKLAQRWYKSIGLRFESTLQGYSVDGSDAVMFVATRGKA